MRIALFTSNHLRHKYIAHQLATVCDVKLIIGEEKSSKIEDVRNYSQEDRRFLEAHFRTRKNAEESCFNNYQGFPKDISYVALKNGGINKRDTLNLLFENEIDAIVLFGTSIIKPIILNEFPDKIINLHLGLSPYYKGSGTNIFPIFYGDFECIGATIHLATKAVDAGDILHQIRPENLEPSDTIHDIGNKVIWEAGRILPKIVKAYFEGKIMPTQQPLSIDEKIFKTKDFTPAVLRKILKILHDDGIKLYLEDALCRKHNKPIISYNDA